MSRTRSGLLLVAVAALVAFTLLLPSVAFAWPAPRYVLKWGTSGSAAGQFDDPMVIAANGLGMVYVPDWSNNRVDRFTTTGGYLGTINDNGGGAGSMSHPICVATNDWGQVFVGESGGRRVDRYTATGLHDLTVGSTLGTSADGAFVTPSGIAVDRFGFIYVADQSLGRIQKFTPAGTYLFQFGAPGSGAGQLSSPSGMTVDPLGNVYVADAGNNRVAEFTGNGAFVRNFGSSSSADGELSTPRDVKMAADGTLYVTNWGHGAVAAFTTTGSYLHSFVGNYDPSEMLFNPYGVAVDGTGVYVSDNGAARIMKFDFGLPKAVARISGADQYAEAANLAANRWPGFSGIHDVVLVNGEDGAVKDALAVAPLAGIYNAPVLLTNKGKLTNATNTAIKAMRAHSGPLAIHVIGDGTLVSATAYNKARSDNPGGTIERIGGHDPYALSVTIALRVKSIADARGIVLPYVLVFNGETPASYFDALAAGAAGHSCTPMLAVRRTSVPTIVRAALATTFAGRTVYAVNSATYLSAAMYSAVHASDRLSEHADRAASAADIAAYLRDTAMSLWTSVAVANTNSDAIPAAAYIGQQGGVLLYSPKSSWPAANTTFLGLGPVKIATENGVVIGPSQRVSAGVKSRFFYALNQH